MIAQRQRDCDTSFIVLISKLVISTSQPPFNAARDTCMRRMAVKSRPKKLSGGTKRISRPFCAICQESCST
jgi:hypothetical protein